MFEVSIGHHPRDTDYFYKELRKLVFFPPCLTMSAKIVQQILDINFKSLKEFFESQFKYCPLIWLLSSRKSNNRNNRIIKLYYEL